MELAATEFLQATGFQTRRGNWVVVWDRQTQVCKMRESFTEGLSTSGYAIRSKSVSFKDSMTQYGNHRHRDRFVIPQDSQPRLELLASLYQSGNRDLWIAHCWVHSLRTDDLPLVDCPSQRKGERRPDQLQKRYVKCKKLVSEKEKWRDDEE